MTVAEVQRKTHVCVCVCVQESEIKWASRWDTYLTMSDVQIHWFSIVNSVVVVFFLSGASSAIQYKITSSPFVCFSPTASAVTVSSSMTFDL